MCGVVGCFSPDNVQVVFLQAGVKEGVAFLTGIVGGFEMVM